MLLLLVVVVGGGGGIVFVMVDVAGGVGSVEVIGGSFYFD